MLSIGLCFKACSNSHLGCRSLPESGILLPRNCPFLTSSHSHSQHPCHNRHVPPRIGCLGDSKNHPRSNEKLNEADTMTVKSFLVRFLREFELPSSMLLPGQILRGSSGSQFLSLLSFIPEEQSLHLTHGPQLPQEPVSHCIHTSSLILGQAHVFGT